MLVCRILPALCLSVLFVSAPRADESPAAPEAPDRSGATIETSTEPLRLGVPITEDFVRSLIRNLESRSATERDYARNVLGALPPESLRKPLIRALYDRSAGIRRWAAGALAGVRDNTVIRPLVSAAVEDKDEGVRDTAVSTLTQLAGREIAWSFIATLNNDVPRFRINAYKALARIGNPHAIGVLVRRKRLYAVGGGGQRAHIFVGEQISYVKDYDVEIASNAAAVDPVMGVINNGTVLDAKPVRTEHIIDIEERVVLGQALAKLTGVDKGNDVAAWVEWWESNRAHLIAEYDRENAVAKRDQEADYVWTLARKYERLERWDDAIRQYQLLVDKYAGSLRDAGARERLATLESSASIRAQRAAHLDDQECKRLLSQAETCLMSGRRDAAVEAAQRLLDHFPDSEYAERARQVLIEARNRD